MKKLAAVGMLVMLAAIILSYMQIPSFFSAQGQEERARQVVKKNAEKKDICFLAEKEQEILHAYAEYFQKIFEENFYANIMDFVKYDFVYIDEDDIPELAIVFLPCHADGVHICVYNDGAVVEVGEYGSIGTFLFKPYENLIFSGISNMGEGFCSFYQVEGTESIELQNFHDWEVYRDGQYIEEGYEVDGVEVSKEEFDEAYRKWGSEEMVRCGYYNAVSVTDINNLYGEFCRRFFVRRKSVWPGK